MEKRNAFWIAIFLGCSWIPVHAGEVQVGAANAEFQLPANVPLAGYTRRHGKPSTGVHDPVGVRALVFRDGAAAAAVVSADLLVIDETLLKAVREELTGAGWPAEGALLLAATHTHAGPGAYGKRFLEKVSMGHFDPEVLARIVETIAGTVMAAQADVTQARMASAVVAAPEFVLNRMEDGGGIDPELIAVGWYRPEAATPFALLMTYSAHPTVLGPSNMDLSGEYPGAAMREAQRLLPGATALFFAGAMGDQGPVKGGEGFARIEEIGRGLAGRAVEALRNSAPKPMEHLVAQETRMPLPPAQVRIDGRRLPRWLGRRLVDDDATLSLVGAGEVMFIGAPCDLASPFGLRLKQAARAHGRQPVVVGFANDYIGYCVLEAWYESGEYEAGMAFNGPKTGELITEQLLKMIEEMVNSSGHET